jgi:hypothetical protein
MINYKHLFLKFKLLGNLKFIHLIIIRQEFYNSVTLSNLLYNVNQDPNPHSPLIVTIV